MSTVCWPQPRWASWYATAAPMIPPPQMTTRASFGGLLLIESKVNPYCWKSSLHRSVPCENRGTPVDIDRTFSPRWDVKPWFLTTLFAVRIDCLLKMQQFLHSRDFLSARNILISIQNKHRTPAQHENKISWRTGRDMDKMLTATEADRNTTKRRNRSQSVIIVRLAYLWVDKFRKFCRNSSGEVDLCKYFWLPTLRMCLHNKSVLQLRWKSKPYSMYVHNSHF